MRRSSRWSSGSPTTPIRVALVREPTVPGPGDAGPLVGAAGQRVRRARALLAEQGGAPPLPPELALDGGGDAEVASWQLCAAAPLTRYDAQRLLAAHGTAERLQLLAELMEELELDLHRMLRADERPAAGRRWRPRQDTAHPGRDHGTREARQ